MRGNFAELAYDATQITEPAIDLGRSVLDRTDDFLAPAVETGHRRPEVERSRHLTRAVVDRGSDAGRTRDKLLVVDGDALFPHLCKYLSQANRVGLGEWRVGYETRAR